MPQCCVVGSCSRTSLKNPDVAFLSFPKRESVRRSWVRFVNNTRSDFVLTEWSKVCSAHFSDEHIDCSYRMKKSLGIPAQFKLAEGAVPTSKAPSIWESTSNDVDSTAETSCDVPQDRKSGGAFHKRERARVCWIWHRVYRLLFWPKPILSSGNHVLRGENRKQSHRYAGEWNSGWHYMLQRSRLNS